MQQYIKPTTYPQAAHGAHRKAFALIGAGDCAAHAQQTASSFDQRDISKRLQMVEREAIVVVQQEIAERPAGTMPETPEHIPESCIL